MMCFGGVEKGVTIGLEGFGVGLKLREKGCHGLTIVEEEADVAAGLGEGKGVSQGLEGLVSVAGGVEGEGLEDEELEELV